jgi:hypothetical protein
MWMGNDDAFCGAAPGALALLCSVHRALTLTYLTYLTYLIFWN